jgi:hypothetical protein
MSDTIDCPPAPSDLTGRRMERHSPLLEETWRYWSSLRSGGDVPERTRIEPASMSLILGHSMILDRLRPNMVRVRVGGRVMNDMMGMDVRGLPFRAFFEIAERDKAVALVETVFTDPATLELDLTCAAPEGTVHARMLVLPLRDRQDRVSKALSCIAVDRIDGLPPHRFSIRRKHLVRLRPPADPAFGMREARTGFDPGPRPYLRVVR